MFQSDKLMLKTEIMVKMMLVGDFNHSENERDKLKEYLGEHSPNRNLSITCMKKIHLVDAILIQLSLDICQIVRHTCDTFISFNSTT